MRKVSRQADSNESRRGLAEVVADGVVAAYVHEISDRHDGPASAEDQAPRLSDGHGFDLD